MGISFGTTLEEHFEGCVEETKFSNGYQKIEILLKNMLRGVWRKQNFRMDTKKLKFYDPVGTNSLSVQISPPIFPKIWAKILCRTAARNLEAVLTFCCSKTYL